MVQYRASRRINAPADRVFDTIAHIDNYSKAVPHIVKAEFLSDTKSGVGTRFRETRMMNGREATTELEVTEYVENDRIRLVADSHGTVWDSVFTVAPVEGQTELELVMDAKSYKLLSKVMNALIKSMVQKALEADMDSVKTYCET